jgi:hypothetical protein
MHQVHISCVMKLHVKKEILPSWVIFFIFLRLTFVSVLLFSPSPCTLNVKVNRKEKRKKFGRQIKKVRQSWAFLSNPLSLIGFAAHQILAHTVNVRLYLIIGTLHSNMFIKILYSTCSARDWERSGLLEENPQSGCALL